MEAQLPNPATPLIQISQDAIRSYKYIENHGQSQSRSRH